MELRLKYRPKSLKKFRGNNETIESIQALHDAGELPHSIILSGPKGCGKTTLGRIIMKMVGAKGQDKKELDTGVFRGIDTVRDIREQLIYPPREGDARAWLIDEAHMLGVGGASKKNPAQNALLKSLEEPPEYVYFILCTTNPEMLIPTIRDRCFTFKVAPLSKPDTIKLIKFVCKKEGKEYSKKIAQKIYKVGEGSPRNSLNLLEKVINLKSNKKKLKMINVENLEDNAEIIELCRVLMAGKSWPTCAKILKGLKGKEPETIRQGIMGYAQSVLLNGNEEGNLILGWFVYRPTYDAGMAIITQFCYNVLKRIEPPC